MHAIPGRQIHEEQKAPGPPMAAATAMPSTAGPASFLAPPSLLAAAAGTFGDARSGLTTGLVEGQKRERLIITSGSVTARATNADL